MDQRYLGDSYDLVKRFFCQILSPIASLYAHEKFVPPGIREAYTKLTGIQVFGTRPEGRFGVLLDPDTGATDGHVTRKHASLQFIADVNREFRPAYIVCFDQSYHRKHKNDKKEQRLAKLLRLRALGLQSFYYSSHAPFLFAAESREVVDVIFDLLRFEGIPDRFLQRSEITV